jgi:hypothetical protein
MQTVDCAGIEMGDSENRPQEKNKPGNMPEIIIAPTPNGQGSLFHPG